VTQSIETQLLSAAWAFHTAVQRRDGIEARLRRGEQDPELFDRSLTAAESVVQARIELYRLLITDGWIPPPTVAGDLEYDDCVLHQAAEHLA
jgi:hypothetical protein